MRCPYCRETNQDKVIDSRLSENGEVVRRRRACISCGKRFTTKERVEHDVRLMVIKRDGTRVPYDRAKILAGIQRATRGAVGLASVLKMDLQSAAEKALTGGRGTLGAFGPRLATSSEENNDKPAAVSRAVDALGLGYHRSRGSCTLENGTASPDVLFFY
jgi:hypothetical protein